MKKTRFFALILAFLMILSSFTFAVSADIQSTRQALIDKIQHAEASYPPPGSNPLNSTVAALSAAIDEATKVLNDENSTEGQLQAQIYLLDEAIKGIVILDLDNSKLWEAMVLANSLNPEDYTEGSYEAMKMLANDYFVLHYAQSQKELDDATDRIYQAILDLVPIGTATVPYIDEELYTSGKQKFLNALGAAEEQLLTVGGNYNNETYRVFIDAYEKAMAIYESGEELTNDEYLALAEELESAIAGIEYFNWNTDELWEVIESCEPLYEEIKNGKYFYDTFLDKYHEESNNARMALYYGQSQEEVDNAAKALKEAARRLIPQDNIKGELEEEVKLTEEFNLPNEDNYTKSSFEQVVLMYQYSKGLLAENAQESTMMQAIYDLRDAKDNLCLATDTPASSEATTNEATEATEVVTSASAETDPTEVITTPETSTATEPTEATTVTTSVSTSEVTTIASDTNSTEITASSATAPATTEAIHTVKPNPNYMIGDADENSKINIKDATTLQKHLAKLITLSDTGVLAGDANEDGKLNVKDATEIQKHLANLPSNNHIGMEIVTSDTTLADTTVIPWATETIPLTSTIVSTKDEEITTATEIVTTVVTEPFDTTEATAVTDVTVATVATDATDATEETSEPTTVTTATANTEASAETFTTETAVATEEETTKAEEKDEFITLYFHNSQNWQHVNVHYWNESTLEASSWPGIPMEFVEQNTEYGDMYKAEIPASATGVVFNGGGSSAQTIDVLDFYDEDGFYPYEFDGQCWTVGTIINGKPKHIDYKLAADERLSKIEDITVSDSTINYYLFTIKEEADKTYNHLVSVDEMPAIDTEDLAKRGKGAIVILICLGSGSNTISIDDVYISRDYLYIDATINIPYMGTSDLNYRALVLEVNLEDLEGLEDMFFFANQNFIGFPIDICG